MKKVKLSKDKLEEYQALIQQLNQFFDGLPDGAYSALMEDETRRWLKENNIKVNALDFYINIHQRNITMTKWIKEFI